jgi:hypothetical protein
MGNLLISSTRPSVISYNGNDVKKVIYNGVVVWAKAQTATPTPDKASLSLYSGWSYTYASVSGNTYTYRKNSGPSSASDAITFDLSSIPSGATISSAILSWTYGNSLSGTSGISVGPTGGDYATVGIADSGHTVNLNSSGSDFKDYITPGAINKFNFYYYPSGVRSTVTTNV